MSYFAKDLKSLFLRSPHLANDPDKYTRLGDGWFADLNDRSCPWRSRSRSQEIEEGGPIHNRQFRHLRDQQTPRAQGSKSANRRANPDQGIESPEIQALCQA